MKVLHEAGKGVEEGARLSLEEMGLPVAGNQAALLIFWKRQ
jgi:hypothetical protein